MVNKSSVDSARDTRGYLLDSLGALSGPRPDWDLATRSLRSGCLGQPASKAGSKASVRPVNRKNNPSANRSVTTPPGDFRAIAKIIKLTASKIVQTNISAGECDKALTTFYEATTVLDSLPSVELEGRILILKTRLAVINRALEAEKSLEALSRCLSQQYLARSKGDSGCNSGCNSISGDRVRGITCPKINDAAYGAETAESLILYCILTIKLVIKWEKLHQFMPVFIATLDTEDGLVALAKKTVLGFPSKAVLEKAGFVIKLLSRLGNDAESRILCQFFTVDLQLHCLPATQPMMNDSIRDLCLKTSVASFRSHNSTKALIPRLHQLLEGGITNGVDDLSDVLLTLAAVLIDGECWAEAEHYLDKLHDCALSESQKVQYALLQVSVAVAGGEMASQKVSRSIEDDEQAQQGLAKMTALQWRAFNANQERFRGIMARKPFSETSNYADLIQWALPIFYIAQETAFADKDLSDDILAGNLRSSFTNIVINGLKFLQNAIAHDHAINEENALVSLAQMIGDFVEAAADGEKLLFISNWLYRKGQACRNNDRPKLALRYLELSVAYSDESSWSTFYAKCVALLALQMSESRLADAKDMFLKLFSAYWRKKASEMKFDSDESGLMTIMSLCHELLFDTRFMPDMIDFCRTNSDDNSLESRFLEKLLYVLLSKRLRARRESISILADSVSSSNADSQSKVIYSLALCVYSYNCLAFSDIIKPDCLVGLEAGSQYQDNAAQLCLRLWSSIFANLTGGEELDINEARAAIKQLQIHPPLLSDDKAFRLVALSFSETLEGISEVLVAHNLTEEASAILSLFQAQTSQTPCIELRDKFRIQLKLFSCHVINQKYDEATDVQSTIRSLYPKTKHSPKLSVQWCLSKAKRYLSRGDISECLGEISHLYETASRCDSLKAFRESVQMGVLEFVTFLAETLVVVCDISFRRGNAIQALKEVEMANASLRQYLFPDDRKGSGRGGAEYVTAIGVFIKHLEKRATILEFLGNAKEARYVYEKGKRIAQDLNFVEWKKIFETRIFKLQFRCRQIGGEIESFQETCQPESAWGQLQFLDACAHYFNATGDLHKEHDFLRRMAERIEELHQPKPLCQERKKATNSRRAVSTSQNAIRPAIADNLYWDVISREIKALCKCGLVAEAEAAFQRSRQWAASSERSSMLSSCRLVVTNIDQALAADPTFNGIRDSVISLPSIIPVSRGKSANSRGKDNVPNRAREVEGAESLEESLSQLKLGSTKREGIVSLLMQSQQQGANMFACEDFKLSTIDQGRLGLMVTDQTLLVSALSNEQQSPLTGAYFFEMAKGSALKERINRKRAGKTHAPSSWPRILNEKRELAPSISQFQSEYLDNIPADWLVLSFGVGDSPDDIIVSRMGSKIPILTFQLPISRHSSRETDEESLTLEQAQTEMAEIIEQSNKSTKLDGSQFSRQQKRDWWTERQSLDDRLHDLLQNIELCWIGGLRGIFSTAEIESSAFARFKKRFYQIISRHVPKWSVRDFELSEPVLELLVNFGEIDEKSSELLEDLLYFVFDIYQLHGQTVAYHEIDFDELVVDMKGAIDAYKSAAAPRSPVGSQDEHIVLIIDKNLHQFPWESLPSLRGRSVSRVPSIFALRDCLNKPADVSPLPGSFVLNPSCDLKNTQGLFQDKLEGLGWGGMTCKVPDESRFLSYLRDSSIFLYFGHSGGEQYARGSMVADLPRCAVSIIMGCSSGSLTSQGEFDPYGNPFDYLSGGCPCLVANLWDVTDRDIDKFSDSMLDKWGLWGGTCTKDKPRTSLTQAIAQSRDLCKMKYLIGASPVVYGVPQWLHRT